MEQQFFGAGGVPRQRQHVQLLEHQDTVVERLHALLRARRPIIARSGSSRGSGDAQQVGIFGRVR